MRPLRALLQPSQTRTYVCAALTGLCGGATVAQQQSRVSTASSEFNVTRFFYRPLTPDATPRSSLELDPSAPMRQRMEAMVWRVQDEICAGIEAIDGGKFQTDAWEREGHGGGGRSRVLQDSKVFEKAGVGVSIVHGKLPAAAQAQMRARGKPLEDGKELPFYACGISLVMHPRNPMCPTIHLNYRYFELETGRLDKRGNPEKLAWFGGGADLTPSFVFEDDARHFHAVYKSILDKRDPKWYPAMKKECDKYFYLPHREEARGIGGFFFDDLEDTSEATFQTIRACANAMLDSYVPILERRKDLAFTPAQKDWQQVRRGRYVEFNVMVDRGTKFGLATPGSRIESILMSLPLTARWEYNHKPPAGSWEEKSLQVFKNPVDWMDVPPMELEKVATKELLAEIARRTNDN